MHDVHYINIDPFLVLLPTNMFYVIRDCLEFVIDSVLLILYYSFEFLRSYAACSVIASVGMWYV